MAAKASSQEPDPGEAGRTAQMRVVGIGSSAGGLEALTEMLRSLPTGLPLAYVVAQHMSPTHDSPLPEMLGRETALSVRVATDGALLEPGVILVAPPNADISVRDSAVALSSPGDQARPKPSVDVLLRTLATSWGENAVGVVLSGTGHDGADGLRAVRAAGGLTIAQQLDTARFEGMPSAAVLTGAVDLVLAPGEIGAALARVLSPAPPAPGRPAQDPDEDELVKEILLALRAATGADFTDYKRSTLMRQIARRTALRNVGGLAQYHQLLAGDPEEARALTSLMLVTVTSFFRDTQVWDALTGPLAELAKGLSPDQQMRAWVPGCATGEEAYTVAMLAAAALGAPADLPRRLKVFATDLNEASLDIARRGRYPDDAVEPIPAELRARWLHQVPGGWDVAPVLRDVTVFARHNVALDPPFPKIDLISMRNVLIYFRGNLQERVLRTCHFALSPEGLLVLGDSERINDVHPLFEPVEAKTKIYRRRAGATPYPLPAPQLLQTEYAARALPPGPGRDRDGRAAMRDALIRTFAPPSLVLDDNDEVVEVIGDVSLWCWVADGRHSSHVVALLRDDLKSVVSSLLIQLRHAGVPSAERDVTTANGRVRVAVQRLRGDSTAVVSFGALDARGTDQPPVATQPPASGQAEVDRVSRELESTREALQATIEELGASNEELQVMNEELQASAEELQVSSEEVQASNEELEATNEELRTLNQELQVRASELAAANSDLQNIEDSLTSGLVLVDRAMRVTRFTPLAVRLFALIEHDLGRTLLAIPTTVPLPALERDLNAAIAGQPVTAQEVSGDNVDFLVQVQPYRGSGGEIRGAVIVITDVSELAAARREIGRRLRDFTNVTEAVREMLWQRDANGHLQFLNSRVEDLFGLNRQRVLADPSLLLSAVHPDDRSRVQTAAAAAHGRWELDYRIVRPDGAIRWIKECAVDVPSAGGDPGYTVGSALDVTEQHALALAENSRTAVLEAVLDNRVFGVVVLDERGQISQANKVFEDITGYRAASMAGMPLAALLTIEADTETGERPDEGAVPALEPGTQRATLIAGDGTRRLVTVHSQLIGDGALERVARLVVVQDVTGLQAVGSRLVTQARFDQQTGLAGRSYFRARVSSELGRAERTRNHVAVLWIDLDGFKEVNDHYGHGAGDDVLREVADRLQKTARMQDLVGRLGGDEFAIMMTEASADDRLEIVAERVLTVLRDPVTLNESVVHLSGSIGIAVSPDDGTDAEELLHHADTAMYAAKELGRDRRVYFRAEMNEAAEVRAELRHTLGAAVRSRDFTMHYQPVVETGTGAIRMAEALVRWRRDGKLTPAAEFIEPAEQTGQMRAIGRIVLELIEHDLQALSTAHDSPLPIAVNLSTSQLEDRETADWLLAWEPFGGISRIVFEITESVDLTQSGRSLETLTLLQRLGATISIDGFGTGYSNFRLLDTLRPNMIKVDRSLLAAASHDPHALGVFSAAVAMARALAEEVVVEGIETEEQWDLAVRLDAHLSQGFYIARPMPLDEVATWRGRPANTLP
jgi:two-component system CheB/CheR fusion protein